jgi:hypothetical protein
MDGDFLGKLGDSGGVGGRMEGKLAVFGCGLRLLAAMVSGRGAAYSLGARWTAFC